jgi:sugar O-acyltransferase (sialic acid O-acetyltransferase NeuD family)
LLVIGGGAHGHVVADLAATEGSWSDIAFLDDEGTGTRPGSWGVAGRFGDLATIAGRFDGCVAAMGDAKLRLEWLDRAQAAGLRIPTLVHPRATVSRHARLDAGVVVCAGAVVCIGATIGRGAIVNTGATVDHDCRLGAGVHVCPGAHLAGSVEIGARTWFGIGAVARQGIRIGADATVGAGAVCVESVRDGATVFGVPAREQRS